MLKPIKDENLDGDFVKTNDKNNGTSKNLFYEHLEKQSENGSGSLQDIIFKAIDDAIKNKDRYVYLLFMGDQGMSMSVYPYEKGLQKWVRVSSDKFQCPNCGYLFDYDHLFCPSCGEQLGRSDS